MKIPEEYTETEGKAFKRGVLYERRRIYRENGRKGGKNRWEGVSLEDRVEHAMNMANIRWAKKKEKKQIT